MKKNLWWIILFAAAGVFLWRDYTHKDSGLLRETVPDFRWYSSNKGKFTMMVPADWVTKEATGEGTFLARVVFYPGENTSKVGNIGELSVTVIASPSAGQSLSTQKEFDYWMSQPVKEATSGGIVKLANEKVAGQTAVRLAEIEPIPQLPGINFFSVTTWFRSENINYYVNIMGNSRDIKSENGSFSWMLSKFKLLD